MHDDFPFLRAIISQADDALLLIYADWLEERGDPRAAFLRLHHQLQQLPKDASTQRTALELQLLTLQPKLDAAWVNRMWWARNVPSGVRRDLVLLREGKGLIEVRGDQQETILYVEGKPIALNWDDCCGSVGQYLVFTGHTCGSAYVRQLRELVAGRSMNGLSMSNCSPCSRYSYPGPTVWLTRPRLQSKIPPRSNWSGGRSSSASWWATTPGSNATWSVRS